MPLADKLAPAPQKKLLALDGGGIRGVITLQVLAKLEDFLRQSHAGGSPNFRLCDYFDYIGGTSTGAIIAATLSLGMSVAEVSHFYHTSAVEMFSKAGYLKRFQYKYVDDHLASQLKAIFGADTTLGSDKLRTLLMMVLRNATTDSPWPVCNNPRAKYNDCALPDCNLKIPLWQLIRASTAAPVYFPPEMVHVGGQQFLFVDGGVTTYNNPAFQLFLMATVEAYKLNWPAAKDKLLVVSVGTGTAPNSDAALQAKKMNVLYNAESLPSALMFAALNEQDFLCRVFGECLAGTPLDTEVGDMKNQPAPGGNKLFTYLRYNAELTDRGLDSLGLSGIRPDDVRMLDSIDHIPDLQRIGQAVADSQVNPAHFAGF